MRTRISPMFNTENLEERFGVQVKTKTGWRHVADEGKLCVFDTLEEAEALRKELRKRPMP